MQLKRALSNLKLENVFRERCRHSKVHDIPKKLQLMNSTRRTIVRHMIGMGLLYIRFKNEDIKACKVIHKYLLDASKSDRYKTPGLPPSPDESDLDNLTCHVIQPNPQQAGHVLINV